jgi:hypothetical protein
MAQFTNITLNEFREFLRSEKGWREELVGNEVVFCYRLISYQFIQIKVYSSVRLNELNIRGCGQDSIKVAAVNTNTHQGWIKSAHVLRVEGWKNNLRKRIELVIKQSKARLH